MTILEENKQFLSSYPSCWGMEANLATNLHITNDRLAEAAFLVDELLELVNSYSDGKSETAKYLQEKAKKLLRDSTVM